MTVKPVVTEKSSLLDIAVAVLTLAGKPCHHTTMQEIALAEYGETRDIATPAWRDSRLVDQSKADGRVIFLQKSVYGLKGRDEGKLGSEFAPDRRKGGAKPVQTPEQIRAEAERLLAQIGLKIAE